MSMVVRNNTSAELARQHNNDHTTEMMKALKIVSTGQKLNSAKDDAANYAISERMRNMIRGLDQSRINTQNGNALLSVAAAGIDSIIEELRTLNELTINAQNDSNTDTDRATMQKEFVQRVETINEIAFNTKYNGLNLLGGEFGIRVGGEPATGDVDDLTQSFSASTNAVTSSNLTSRAGLTADYSFTGTSSPFEVKIGFSHLKDSDLSALGGRGFVMLCSGCSQYLNFKFDANKNNADSVYNPNASTTNAQAREYTIGIKDVTKIADLSKAIFDGIVASRGYAAGSTNVSVDSIHTVNIKQNSDGSYSFTKDSPSLAMQFATGSVDASGQIVDDGGDDEDLEEPWDPKVYSPLVIHYGDKANQDMQLYINDMSTRRLKTRVIYKNDVTQLENLVNNKEEYESYKEYLKSTKGVSARDIEYLERFRDDKETYNTYKAILEAARKKTLDDVTLKTIQDAKVTQRVVEGAIDYALNEATSVGAYAQRLQHESDRLSTMSENAQSAESRIRDADMATSITNFTKSNMLAKSSEAMLAQANQSSSDVIGLLQ